MSKDSKQTTDSRNVQLPKAPDYIRNGVEGLTGAILNLGNRNPQSYVPGASGLQSQAFGGASSLASRYFGGGNTAQPIPYMQGADGQPQAVGGGLFSQLGVNTPSTPVYDWDAIGADRAAREPGFVQGFNSLTEQNHKDIAELLGSPDQRINQGQYAQYMRDYDQPWSPEIEARFAELSGGNGKTQNPFSTTGVAGPSPTQPIKYGGAPQGPNPLDMYSDSAGIARDVAGAGPTQGNYGGVFDLLGGDISPIASTSMRAASLLDGLDGYISPYTDQVVDTTLANYDVNAERQNAQTQAAAAGNGAFGGSRFGVMDAILRGEQGRLRASTEAGLRDDAFNTGAQLSNLDAGRRQEANRVSADMAHARALQEASMKENRALQEAAYRFQAAMNDQQAQESALDRSLRAGDSLRATGAQQTQDELSTLGLLGALGEQERGIAAGQANAELGLLGTITDLFRGLPFSQVTGIVNNGTQTTTTTPGLFDMLGAGGSFMTGLGNLANWRIPPVQGGGT